MTAAGPDPALIAEIGRMMRELAVHKRRAAALEDRLTEQRRRQDLLFRALERSGIGEDDAASADALPPLPLSLITTAEAGLLPAPAAADASAAAPPLRPRTGYACLGLEGADLPVTGVLLPAAAGAVLVATVRAVAARQAAGRDFLPVFVLDAEDVGPVRRRGYSYAWIPPAPDVDPDAAADHWLARLDRLRPLWRFDRLEIGATPVGRALAARLSGAPAAGPQ